jgi:RND superfamily putative drug exporter
MYRRRRWAVAVTVAFVVFAGVWGTQVFGSLTGGGFEDPGSDSYRAAEVAAERLGRDDADVIVLYRSEALTVDDAAFEQAVTATLAALPSGVVDRTVTTWSTG